MSVKTTYESLSLQADETRKRIRASKNGLEEDNREYLKLQEQKKELSKRTSELAKSLLAKVSEQVAQVEEKISDDNKLIEKLTESLIAIEEKLEKCPKDYIQEQSSRMLQEFLEYVSKNEEELGSNLQTTFCICEEKRHESSRYGNYYIPTGNIVIRKGEYTITISKVFYGKEEALYDIKRSDSLDYIYALYTSWFVNYLAEFSQALQDKVQSRFKEHPNFKVDFSSFKDNHRFTLELK